MEVWSKPAENLTAGLLLDSRLQMRCFSANGAWLTQTKHTKIGEHEQGR